METRIDPVQGLEDLLQADLSQHTQLERRTRTNWLLLVATSSLATIGLAFAMAPILHDDISAIWPWAYTDHLLLAGLSLCVSVLAWYLTQQERRVTSLRGQLQESRRRELKYCKSYGRAVAQANAEMHREIDERKRIEMELRRLNETLEDRVSERSEAVRRHAQDLAGAKQVLEEQNQRLRELYNTAHQFVDHVSHEFRTPLMVIKEYAGVIGEGMVGETTREQRDYLRTIVNRVDDLNVLVEDLLDISRIEADLLRTARRPCTIAELFDHVRPTLERKADGSQAPLELDVPADLPPVYCDPEKVGRILINLGINAIKFSRGGTPVRMWARRTEDGREIQVGVTDRGPGIAREDLEIIFERFRQLDNQVRTSAKGFGLGLNIVKELVQLHFGRLHVESALGEGSTFSFTIPLAAAASLLPVYLQRVRTMRGNALYVSLMKASSAAADRPALEAVQSFLEHNIRRTDLLFPSVPPTWLLVAPTREDGTEQLIARMQRAHAEALRAQAHGSLPDVSWNVEGCWRIEEEGSLFIARFLALHETVTKGAGKPPVRDAAGQATR